MIPLALSTKGWIGVGVLAAFVAVFLLAPLRLLLRLRKGDDIDPAGSDGTTWGRKKKETPEDFD